MAKDKKSDQIKTISKPKVEKKEKKDVQMFHINDSVIMIKESEVKAHLAAGWRLNK